MGNYQRWNGQCARNHSRFPQEPTDHHLVVNQIPIRSPDEVFPERWEHSSSYVCSLTAEKQEVAENEVTPIKTSDLLADFGLDRFYSKLWCDRSQNGGRCLAV